MDYRKHGSAWREVREFISNSFRQVAIGLIGLGLVIVLFMFFFGLVVFIQSSVVPFIVDYVSLEI